MVTILVDDVRPHYRYIISITYVQETIMILQYI